MGKCLRLSVLGRRACLVLVLLLAAGASPQRADDRATAGFEATAYPHVFTRTVPGATSSPAASSAGQIYVKPGAKPVTRAAAPPLRLAPVPAPGGGTMAVIPEALYPAAAATVGPDGQLVLVCDDDREHDHAAEVRR